eukprot:gene22732-29896_t
MHAPGGYYNEGLIYGDYYYLKAVRMLGQHPPGPAPNPPAPSTHSQPPDLALPPPSPPHSRAPGPPLMKSVWRFAGSTPTDIEQVKPLETDVKETDGPILTKPAT